MKIGIIGLGAMGKLYARKFAKLGHDVRGSDLPVNRSKLENELSGIGVKVLYNNIAVARDSDLLIYSVEAENIDEVVSDSAYAIGKGTIVSGQTSVKTPEVKAFNRYLKDDIPIIPVHSLHGPSVDPRGQTLIAINHRSFNGAYGRTLEAFRPFGSNIVELPDYEEHDKRTANTQAASHLGFLSMGTAWKGTESFPWENNAYMGGLDNVKALMAMRILDAKSHIYAGLALMNPFAKAQIDQYARSTSELFKMVIQDEWADFWDRTKKAGEFLHVPERPLIGLDAEVMGEYSLEEIPVAERRPNSHLSLLAMGDAWRQMGINPYEDMICQTPVFRLRLGLVEHLFQNFELLHESARAPFQDKLIRGDDLEFVSAVKEWATIVDKGDMAAYKAQFDETREFFVDRLPEAKRKSGDLIKRLSEVPA